MKTILTLLLIFIGGNVFAQLASEKPMTQVYSQPVKQKLDQPKSNGSTAKQLPSEAPMPKQVAVAKTKAPAGQATGSEEQRKKLPSNAKKIPAVKPPKKN
jgi:hypothetical protein